MIVRDVQEAETTLHVNTEFKIKLDDHPYAEHLPPRAVMLSKVRVSVFFVQSCFHRPCQPVSVQDLA